MTVPIGELVRSTTHGPYLQQHLWFGPPERPLSGWLAAPRDGRARGGVVLAPPLGAEVFHTYRTMRRLTDDLAEAGFLALRLDYDGTGDSAGSVEDPDRVRRWLGSIAAARAQLRSLGVPSVSVVGLRFGATLAAYDAATLDASDPGDPGIDGLVLWDPVPSGRVFLREGEALFGLGVDARTELDPQHRHTPGFQFSSTTASDLRAIDLAKLPQGRLADRVLLLERADRPGQDRLRDLLLKHQGGELATAPAREQALLLDGHASEAIVPERTLADIVDWLGSRAPASTEPIEPAEPAEPPRPEAALVAPGVVERVVRLGDVGLFGIETRPEGVATGGPWVVLVNTAAEHHIGPGRQWVEWARRWAASGYRVLRIDQSGIGDSPTRPEQPEDAAFAPEWIDDMRSTVESLRADGSPVILVGLCAGAYSSMEASMWTTVDAIVALNPRLTLFPAARGTAVYTPIRRAAIVPALPITWVPPRRRALLGAVWKVYRQVSLWNSPAKILRRVVRHGTRLHVIACSDDVRELIGAVLWRPELRRLRRTGRFELLERPEFDHELLTRAAQQVAHDDARRIVDSLHRELR